MIRYNFKLHIKLVSKTPHEQNKGCLEGEEGVDMKISGRIASSKLKTKQDGCRSYFFSDFPTDFVTSLTCYKRSA